MIYEEDYYAKTWPLAMIKTIKVKDERIDCT